MAWTSDVCIHCVWKVVRAMEEEEGMVGAREFPFHESLRQTATGGT